MASGSSEILLTTLVLLSGNVFSIRNTNLKNFNLITTPNLKKIAFSLKKKTIVVLLLVMVKYFVQNKVSDNNFKLRNKN